MDDLVVLEDFFVGSGLVVVGGNGVVSGKVYVTCRWWSSFLISYSILPRDGASLMRKVVRCN